MRAERVGESRESPRESMTTQRVGENLEDSRESMRVQECPRESAGRGRVQGYTEIED